MQLHYPHSIDAIDLSSWDFWRNSLEEREGAFTLLRCRVVSRQDRWSD